MVSLNLSAATIQDGLRQIETAIQGTRYAQQFFMPGGASQGGASSVFGGGFGAGLGKPSAPLSNNPTAPHVTLPDVAMNAGDAAKAVANILKAIGPAAAIIDPALAGPSIVGAVSGAAEAASPWLDLQRLAFLFLGAALIAIGASILAAPKLQTARDLALIYEGVTTGEAVKKAAKRPRSGGGGEGGSPAKGGDAMPNLDDVSGVGRAYRDRPQRNRSHAYNEPSKTTKTTPPGITHIRERMRSKNFTQNPATRPARFPSGDNKES